MELTSHAVTCGLRAFVFDPIDVGIESLGRILSSTQVSVILTNRNHEREALNLCDQLGLPAFAIHPCQSGRLLVGRLEADSDRFSGCRWMELPGGAPGESAFFFESLSLVVFGDAVVNLPGRSLELLPAKYCDDPVRLVGSLRVLIREWRFSNAVFAHGDPLVGDADQRIAALLNS